MVEAKLAGKERWEYMSVLSWWHMSIVKQSVRSFFGSDIQWERRRASVRKILIAEKNILNIRMSRSVLSASVNRSKKLCCQLLKGKLRQKGYITCLSNTVSDKRSYKIWLQRSAQTFYYSTEYYVIVRVWKNYYESCKWKLLKDT